MADITAAMVKDLREKSGAGMMDCKKALNETAGDMDAAMDWLRTKGLAAAAKKSSRTAAEGLVGIAVSGTTGAAVEVNSETDFVAKNDQFQAVRPRRDADRAGDRGRYRRAEGAGDALGQDRRGSVDEQRRDDRREPVAAPRQAPRSQQRRGRALCP